MELVRCSETDLPSRMNEIQWQAMWRYYILPGRLKPPDTSFEGSIKNSDMVLDACLIAVDDGMDAGFCWGALRGDQGWCGGFGVRPEFRRRGIGKALLHGTADALREQGATIWRLEVVQQNIAAVDAYLRAGFSRGRDLGLYRGKVNMPLDPGESIRETTADVCLARYNSWPQVRRTWGAAPEQLIKNQDKYQARELLRDGEPVAFLLSGGNSLVDLGLAPGEPGRSGLKLLAQLPAVNANNLPEDDPVRAELDRCPTMECWVKQWEMIWELG